MVGQHGLGDVGIDPALLLADELVPAHPPAGILADVVIADIGRFPVPDLQIADDVAAPEIAVRAALDPLMGEPQLEADDLARARSPRSQLLA